MTSGRAVLAPPLAVRLADPDAERVRRSHDRAIRDLQVQPGVGLRVIKGVVLPNNVRTPVPHGLGVEPAWVGPSAVRGSVTVGAIIEFRDGVDRKQRVEIAASGYGATITVDLLVVP